MKVNWRPSFPVGVGGFEGHGKEGLIRSIAVRRDHRHGGIGKALCDALQTHAPRAGVERLFLLTENVAVYFSASGSEPVDSKAIPPEVQATRQLSALCPSSAQVMSGAIG